MKSFEQIFNDTETGADDIVRATAQVSQASKALKKAAQGGNINGIRRSSERLKNSLTTLRQVVDNASPEWAISDDQVSQYISDGLTEELKNAAKDAGLKVFEKDGILISYPSTIRLLPSENAVRVDRKKISDIRPTKLAKELLSNQKKGARFSPQAFLQSLHKAYGILNESGTADSAGVLLEKIYEIFTSLPGSSRDYDRMDFARDLYFLEISEVKETRSGARIGLHASTGIRRGKGIFSFVDPNGSTINYYQLSFSGAR